LKNGGSNGMLRAQKGYPYEGGTRTPAFIYGPAFLNGKKTLQG